MRSIRRFFERGTMASAMLVASALVGLIATASVLLIPEEDTTLLSIDPSSGTLILGEEFTIRILAQSDTPVNVFSGIVQFDPNAISITHIDYNTSIADLWAEKPWYNAGEGTLTFGGGTTRKGGFTGTDTVLTITFKAHRSGESVITLREPHIFAHDGLGTDIPLPTPIDALFFVEAPNAPPPSPAAIVVLKEKPSTDITGDGKTTLRDISAFILNMGTDDMRLDFNTDGKVNLSDLSILMNAP